MTPKQSNTREFDDLAESVLQLLRNIYGDSKKAAPKCIYIAYSGGIDSSVLLDVCVQLRDKKLLPCQLKAWHINHRLNPAADEWQEHCRSKCAESELEFVATKIKPVSPSAKKVPANESVEMFARRSRYQTWQEGLRPGEILLQAHHQSDQAETLLLRLARGSTNLKGIPQLRDINSKDSDRDLLSSAGVDLAKLALVARPFLQLSKETINSYALQQKLSHIQDPSNADPVHERNFVRNEIIPKLKSKWPAVERSLAKSALRLNHLHSQQESELQTFRPASKPKIYPVEQVLTLTEHRTTLLGDGVEFERLILTWMKHLGLAPPPVRAIAELQKQLQDPQDTLPLLSWGTGDGSDGERAGSGREYSAGNDEGVGSGGEGSAGNDEGVGSGGEGSAGNDEGVGSGREYFVGGGEIRYYQDCLYAMRSLQAETPKEIALGPVLEKLAKGDKKQVIPYAIGEILVGKIEPSTKIPAAGSSHYELELAWGELATEKDIVLTCRKLLSDSPATQAQKGNNKQAGKSEEGLIQPPQLKKFLQEHSIFPWLRGCLPLLFCDNRFTGALGCCKPHTKSQPKLKITWDLSCLSLTTKV